MIAKRQRIRNRKQKAHCRIGLKSSWKKTRKKYLQYYNTVDLYLFFQNFLRTFSDRLFKKKFLHNIILHIIKNNI